MFYSEVNVDDVRRAIQATDPEISSEEASKYLLRGFGVSTADQLESAGKLETSVLIKRLLTGSVRRIGKKPK